MFNIELPGSSIEVIDEFNQTTYDTSQFGTTESLLIIGTAFDGPVGKEVVVYTPEHANYIFGGAYDYKTRRSASLVAHVQDAYNAGARTIYAMRIGGKEISKIYNLREEKPIYLKVSGLFPSNKYKNMAMLYLGGKIVIFKTADKATIEEKRQGVIESSESIVAVTIDLQDTYGITQNTRLVDMIEFVNKFQKNNVFKLSLVNENGVDITQSELGQTVSVGALMEGLYTIGRKNKEESAPVTSVQATIPTTEPYANFNGNILISVEENTDFEKPYPFYPQSIAEPFFDVLKRNGGLDTLCDPDKIDYEETNLTPFEIYKRLGSGFAQTARVVQRSGKYFVQPTPQKDAGYTVEIADGIYSVAANLKADNRIMVAGYADTKITGKLPSLEDFTQANIQKMPVMFTSTDKVKPAITATYALDNTEVHTYQFDIVAEDFVPVTLQSIKGKLNPSVISLSEVSTLTVGKAAIVESDHLLWIAEKNETDITITPIAEIDVVKEYQITLSQESVGEQKVTKFTIKVLPEILEETMVSEWVDMLKTSVLGHIFNFEYDNEKASLLGAAGEGAPVANKILEVNEKLYIPYTTNDNFVRQLAQHVTYTSLKTYQTHGGIGVAPIIDTSLRAVAEKATKLAGLDFNLYVKNGVGRSVLDKDNLPYHIGKDVSVTAWQHYVTTSDGYNYLTSGVASYFGKASVLSNDVSTTNQSVPVTPSYVFSETQKVALNKKGFVTLDNKNAGYYVTDGVTQAPIYSQFSRYATNRTIKLVNAAIREATEPFIGKKNDLNNRNSMYTAIKSSLDKLVGHYLERYEFSLNYNQYAARLGEINIDYDIDIVDEIRNVKNRVTAKSNM